MRATYKLGDTYLVLPHIALIGFIDKQTDAKAAASGRLVESYSFQVRFSNGYVESFTSQSVRAIDEMREKLVKAVEHFYDPPKSQATLSGRGK